MDGVSLTVNAVDDAGFEVNLVPHTVAHTAFARNAPSAPPSISRWTCSRATSSGCWPPDEESRHELRHHPRAAGRTPRSGRMVVIVDDEDRENEGDLIMAAELVRPTDINFMVTHARGLVCLSLTRERCRAAGPGADGAATTTRRYHTNFTVSIEAAEGVTTGISAYDRAHTIRTAVRPDAKPDDLTPARPHLPADGPARRRAHARRPHRGGQRPGRCWPAWSRPACWSKSSTPTAAWRDARSWKRSPPSTA